MVEEDKYCIDILTQVWAATKAPSTFSLALARRATCPTASSRRAQRGGTEGGRKKGLAKHPRPSPASGPLLHHQRTRPDEEALTMSITSATYGRVEGMDLRGPLRCSRQARRSASSGLGWSPVCI